MCVCRAVSLGCQGSSWLLKTEIACVVGGRGQGVRCEEEQLCSLQGLGLVWVPGEEQFSQLGLEDLGKSFNQVCGGSSAQMEEERSCRETTWRSIPWRKSRRRSVLRTFTDMRSLGLVCGMPA